LPTILRIKGWRVFAFMNEGAEPMHVHARKGDADCKFWIRPDQYEIEEDFAHNLTPALRREIREIIFQHFDLIVEAWRTQWKR